MGASLLALAKSIYYQKARGGHGAGVWEILFYWTPTDLCHVHDLLHYF